VASHGKTQQHSDQLRRTTLYYSSVAMFISRTYQTHAIADNRKSKLLTRPSGVLPGYGG